MLIGMKRCLWLCFMIFGVFAGRAQSGVDTMYSVQLKEVQVKARWLNDTDRYHYNQMKFYVTTILPYVNAATKLFNEVNAKARDESVSRKERRKFINAKE